MRATLLALGLAAASVVATWAVVELRVDLPPVAPSVEQTCADAMRLMAPDHSWIAPGREATLETGSIPTVDFGELPAHSGAVVRVAGVLHAEFEGEALYPSRAAMEQKPRQGLRLRLADLWPDEAYLATKGPLISDRCVMVEGTYSSGWGGQFGLVTGAIQHVRRLDVWSTPHRPFVTPSPPPPSPRAAPACSKNPAPPTRMTGEDTRQAMLAGFRQLHASGEFEIGYCIADVQVDEDGVVVSVRLVRPPDVDARVADILSRQLSADRYRPATACGRPVAFRLAVGVGHCPSRAKNGPKSDRDALQEAM
jgi:hypothetical protein